MTTVESSLLTLPTFTLSTPVHEVIAFLDQHDYSHLALVDANDSWIGNLATSLLYEIDETQTLASISYHVESFYIQPTDDLAKIADTFIQNKCNILPVLDTEHYLIGMLPKAAITANLLESTFLTEVGTTLLIENDTEACSLAKITQLVESNNSKLLGIIVWSTSDLKTQVLLRLTQKNVDTIIQDLRRFDFTIVSQHEEDSHQNKLIDHSNYLNKFLNI
ncbi:CBS domain-containing protein [Myroides sp. WP-1]|uniref:CBS domain-containing protein n=1 Tax=Myroides sp. WP-1 TaxID=2759944 RepID=UPI001C71C62A|nr:CBS domain-containing protein [Myroides sp. WP-1]